MRKRLALKPFVKTIVWNKRHAYCKGRNKILAINRCHNYVENPKESIKTRSARLQNLRAHTKINHIFNIKNKPRETEI